MAAPPSPRTHAPRTFRAAEDLAEIVSIPDAPRGAGAGAGSSSASRASATVAAARSVHFLSAHLPGKLYTRKAGGASVADECRLAYVETQRTRVQPKRALASTSLQQEDTRVRLKGRGGKRRGLETRKRGRGSTRCAGAGVRPHALQPRSVAASPLYPPSLGVRSVRSPPAFNAFPTAISMESTLGMGRRIRSGRRGKGQEGGESSREGACGSGHAAKILRVDPTPPPACAPHSPFRLPHPHAPNGRRSQRASIHRAHADAQGAARARASPSIQWEGVQRKRRTGRARGRARAAADGCARAGCGERGWGPA